jgi:hypothetical protein
MKRSTRLPCLVYTSALVLFLWAPAASGFAFYGEGTLGAPGILPGDLVTNPHQLASWDSSTITYKFDDTFTAAFPNPGIADQIRLAFQEWGSAFVTPLGPTFSFERDATFYDIRSIALHEIGHVLGFDHPDKAAPLGLNFGPKDGGGLSAQPDAPARGLKPEVMHSGGPPRYNHILSHDELQGFLYAYARGLNFMEVTGATTPDILIGTYPDPDKTLPVGEGLPFGESRNAADPTQGLRITSGSIRFSTAPDVGYETKGLNWDYKNSSGKAVNEVIIQTTGTNNPTPVAHYDNNSSDKFTMFTSKGVIDAKDDLIHTWSNPAGGPIPASEMFHVGLMQDVVDWSVVSAQVRDINGGLTNVPVIAWQPWNNSFVLLADPAGPVTGGFDRVPVIVTAHGLRIENSNTPVFLSRFGIAIVDGLNIGLNDLNHNTLDELVQLGRMQFFDESIFLDSLQDFIIMFDGITEGLSLDAFAGNDFLFVNRPDLVNHELFVYALGRNGNIIAGSYGLIGTPLIGAANGLVICDIDGDGKVSRNDIEAILAARGGRDPS